jgi:hypothetical protein
VSYTNEAPNPFKGPYGRALAAVESAHSILHEFDDDSPEHLEVLAKSLELRAALLRQLGADVAAQEARWRDSLDRRT